MQVGRYQVLETLGTGAHGRVVRGFDPLIHRTVAIKLFSPELARPEAQQRFFQEARVVGQLSHTSIIALHDMGIDETSQTPYLVMEFIDGTGLDRLLEKGMIPVSRACAFAGDVAAALAIAHRRGVIHGDVKPGNILVTPENRVKLTDFGMARLSRRDSSGSPLLGTPAYWCPEQIMGKLQDARSDIFSLGVVIYEMVTGQLPFGADSLQAICQRVLSSTPVPASQLNPSLPRALDDVIASCLAKDPAARCDSAEALAESLYLLARHKAQAPAALPKNAPPAVSLRHRASRLLRSA